MGKVMGGGSSINVMVWARGHKSDWDQFAAESGCSAWNHESVRDIFRRIEDWQGAATADIVAAPDRSPSRRAPVYTPPTGPRSRPRTCWESGRSTTPTVR